MAGESVTGEKALHLPSRFAELPDHWGWLRLDDACTGVFDCPHSTPKLVDTGPYVVRSQDIITGIFRTEQAARVAEETYKERTSRAVPARGDLLYSREGTYFGIAAEVPERTRVCLGQRMVLIRPKSDVVDFRFLCRWLNSPIMASHIHGYRDGTVAERLNLPTIRALPVLVPPLPEQRVIAHILGSLDDKIELNRRMNETLEGMTRALFKSWFVDFEPARAKAEGRDLRLPKHLADLFPDSFEDSELGGIPKGWTVSVLNQLVLLVLGGDWGSDAQTEEESEPARCIRGADIPDLQLGGTGKMPLRFLKPSSLEKRRLNEGDLVVEISGGSPTQSTGRPVLVSRGLLNRIAMPVVCSNFCRLLKLKSPRLSNFVYLWLRSLYENDEFLQFENGTTGIKNLAFTLFSSTYKLCLPRMQILEAFDLQVSPLFVKHQANAAEAHTLAALRDTLLPKLIFGELRVKDAERFLNYRGL